MVASISDTQLVIGHVVLDLGVTSLRRIKHTFIVATLLLSHISGHINLLFTVTLPPIFPFPFCFFIFPLLFTLPLHFLHYFLFIIYLLFFSSFYFCINSISFLPFNSYFSHEKIVSTLSFSRFLFFLITLI